MNNNNFSGRPAISVNGFCLASPDLLIGIKSYFGLSADLPLLTVIQRHFATVQRREPTSDELILLDAYFTAEPTDPSRFDLSSLSSDDPRIGETYDDLRAKAAELGRKLPFDLTELFGFGQLCLSYVGRREPRNERVFSGNGALLSLCTLPDSSPALVSSDSVRAALDLSPTPSEKARTVTDCLVHVSGDGESFVAALASLMISGRGRFTVGDAALCGTGRLNALLKLSAGALIDLSVLPDLTLLSLAERSDSSAFLTVSGASAAQFVAEAGRFGLTARVCGRTDKFKRLTVVTGNGMPLTLSTEFLATAVPRFSLTAEVMRREPSAVSDRGFDITTADASGHSRNIAAASGRTLTAVGVKSLSFDDACLTLIEGVGRLVAAGADLNDVRASVELRLPSLTDKVLVGDAVGALLGLYRVQTELCLRTSGGRVDFGEPGLGAVLTARVDAPLPDRLVSPGSRVYLLAPRADEFGLPRFSDLRRLYEYVRGLIKNGEIISAKTVGRSGLDGAIAACSVEHPLYSVGEKTDVSGLGGFIVESENELDGVFLGLCE